MDAAVDLGFVEAGEWNGNGEQPPLMVLHGLFGSGTNWRGVARSLGRNRRVLLVDARNHGASAHAATMDYPAMAEDVRRLIHREDLERVALLGHSMGGKTAMTLALESPVLVERLVVVDIAPASSPGDHAALLAAMSQLDLTRVRRRMDADELLADSVSDRNLRAFLLQNLVSDGERYRWRINLGAVTAALPLLLDFPPMAERRFDGPALFVRGEHSDYLRTTHQQAVNTLFTAAQMVSVPDAGHWVHAENPAGFIRVVESFLN